MKKSIITETLRDSSGKNVVEGHTDSKKFCGFDGSVQPFTPTDYGFCCLATGSKTSLLPREFGRPGMALNAEGNLKENAQAVLTGGLSKAKDLFGRFTNQASDQSGTSQPTPEEVKKAQTKKILTFAGIGLGVVAIIGVVIYIAKR